MNAHFDIIIIGSGAGGGTMAQALSATGARILILERGDFVPQEEENWRSGGGLEEAALPDQGALARRARPRVPPYTHYSVGGNTKFWGSVLYRLRREDFEAVQHADGVSPAWPIDYDTLAPYYDRAERLYHVRGQARRRSHRAAARARIRTRPVPHAPGMAEIVDKLRAQGLHPSPLPLGLLARETDGCILCNTCNSFACKLHAKSEAEVCCVRPAIERPERHAVDERHARTAGRPIASGTED